MSARSMRAAIRWRVSDRWRRFAGAVRWLVGYTLMSSARGVWRVGGRLTEAMAPNHERAGLGRGAIASSGTCRPTRRYGARDPSRFRRHVRAGRVDVGGEQERLGQLLQQRGDVGPGRQELVQGPVDFRDRQLVWWFGLVVATVGTSPTRSQSACRVQPGAPIGRRQTPWNQPWCEPTATGGKSDTSGTLLSLSVQVEVVGVVLCAPYIRVVSGWFRGVGSGVAAARSGHLLPDRRVRLRLLAHTGKPSGSSRRRGWPTPDAALTAGVPSGESRLSTTG